MDDAFWEQSIVNVGKGFAPTLDVSIKQLDTQGAGLKKFTAALAWVDEVSPAKLEDIHNRATQATRSTIRSFLAINYTASGLNVKTGDLYRASVEMANVISAGITQADGTFTINGIYIRLGRGFNRHVYESAGAFRYGGVRGKGIDVMKAANRAGVGHVLGRGGQRQRRKLKKQAERLSKHGVNSAAGVTFIEPRPPFFQLLPDQIQRVATVYQTSFVRQVNVLFRSKS